MSDEDAALLYPNTELDDIAERLIGKGAEVVAITLGAEGARIYSAEHRIVADAPPTDVVDTVGAGDTFQAAYLSRLRKEKLLAGRVAERTSRAYLDGALRFALSAASKTCSRQGADLPYAAEFA